MIHTEILSILKILEITTLVFACLLIFINFLRPSQNQESIGSITGGSTELFDVKKINLSKSIIWMFLLFLILILVVLIITIRIVIYFLVI